jgi:hypothetical protein
VVSRPSGRDPSLIDQRKIPAIIDQGYQLGTDSTPKSHKVTLDRQRKVANRVSTILFGPLPEPFISARHLYCIELNVITLNYMDTRLKNFHISETYSTNHVEHIFINFF